MRTLLEYNNKWLACNSATEALMTETALYECFPDSEMSDLIATAYDCYLHSEEQLDIADFTAWLCNNWATEKSNNKWDTLTNYFNWRTE